MKKVFVLIGILLMTFQAVFAQSYVTYEITSQGCAQEVESYDSNSYQSYGLCKTHLRDYGNIEQVTPEMKKVNVVNVNSQNLFEEERDFYVQDLNNRFEDRSQPECVEDCGSNAQQISNVEPQNSVTQTIVNFLISCFTN